MINNKQLVTYLLYMVSSQLLLIFAGCASGLYAPNMQNVPLLQEKNEIRINTALGITNTDNAVELQLAYAPTAKIGIQVNALLHGYNFYLSKFNNFDVFFGEIGAGYYHPFGNHKHWVFETYGLLGLGQAFPEFSYYKEGYKQYGKFSLQPAIGFTAKAFDAALSARVSYLLNDVAWKRIEENSDGYGKYYETESFLVEPAITLRCGWKYVKLQTQLGVSIGGEKGIDSHANAGIYLSLNKKYPQRAAKKTEIEK